MATNPLPQAANQNVGPGLLSASGAPLGSTTQSSLGTSSGAAGGGGGDPMIDIGKMQTDILWLKKWLERLGIAAAFVLGWILLYLYMPMRDLSTQVAVQSATLNAVGDNVKDIKDSVRAIDSRMDDAADDTNRSSTDGKSGKVHRRTGG